MNSLTDYGMFLEKIQLNPQLHICPFRLNISVDGLLAMAMMTQRAFFPFLLVCGNGDPDVFMSMQEQRCMRRAQ